MDWCHFGALGASVGLLLLWSRRVVKKVDGVVANLSVYVSLDVWMINTSRCFRCLWSQFWAWQILLRCLSLWGFGGVLEDILIWFPLRSRFDLFNDLFHGGFVLRLEFVTLINFKGIKAFRKFYYFTLNDDSLIAAKSKIIIIYDGSHKINHTWVTLKQVHKTLLNLIKSVCQLFTKWNNDYW